MYIASIAGKVQNLRLWVSRSYSQKLKQQKRPMIKWKLYLEKFKNHWKSNFTLLSLYLLLQRRSKAFVGFCCSGERCGPWTSCYFSLSFEVECGLSFESVVYESFLTWPGMLLAILYMAEKIILVEKLG